jgi:Secretion system C-terminal sorting domain
MCTLFGCWQTLKNKNMKNIYTLIICTLLLTTIAQAQEQMLNWATHFSGRPAGYGESVDVDTLGNIFVCGGFVDTVDFDPSANVANLVSKGSMDGYIAKYDDDGNYIWAKSFGGSIIDYGHSVQYDNLGNVYVVGYFNNIIYFTNTDSLVSNGQTDIFLTKYDSNGNFIWARGFGGTSREEGKCLAIDKSGNIYIAGSFNSSIINFNPSGSNNETNTGPITTSDAFIAKYDSAGQYIWSLAFGGAQFDYIFGIATDTNENIYATGGYMVGVDFDPSGNIATNVAVNNEDVFVAKYDSSGTYVWAKGIGGTNTEAGRNVDVSANGDVYVTGQFSGTVDFNIAGSSAFITAMGVVDGFLAKYDNNGNYLWANNFGGLGATLESKGYDIELDEDGYIFLVGDISGDNNDTVTFNTTGTNKYIKSNGFTDGFVAVYNASGDIEWIKNIGGTGSWDGCRGLAIDKKGSAIAYGIFSGVGNFDPIDSTANLTSTAFYDAFIAKYSLQCILDTSVYQNIDTLMSNESGATYQWLDCNNNAAPIAGEINQTYVAQTSGSYAVEITQNGCVDTSVCYSIINVGIIENNFGDKLLIYPNPTDGNFSIDLGDNYQSITVKIMDLSGKLIQSKTYNESQLLNLKLEETAGIYLLIIESSNKKAVIRLIKE